MATYNVGGINPFGREKSIYDAIAKALSDDDVNWLKSEKHQGAIRIQHGIHLTGANKNFKVPEHSIGMSLNGGGNLLLKNLDMTVTELANAIQLANWQGTVELDNCNILYGRRVRENKAYPLFATNDWLENCHIIIRNSTIDGAMLTANEITVIDSQFLSSKNVAEFSANKISFYNTEVDRVNINAGTCVLDKGFIYQEMYAEVEALNVTGTTFADNSTSLFHAKESQFNNVEISQQVSSLSFNNGTYLFENMVMPRIYVEGKNANIKLGEGFQNNAEWIQDNVTFANVGAENVDLVEDEASAIDRLNEMIGLQSVKEQIAKYVATARVTKARQEMGLETEAMGMHLIFGGNPGTGKTVVAQLVAQALYEEGVIEKPLCVVGSRANLVSRYVGATPEKTKEVLESARGGVFFLDEAHRFTSMSEKDHATEAMGEILTFAENERDDVLIILAGYSDKLQEFFEKGDPGMRSRFSNWIEFPDYDFNELYEIALYQFKGFELDAEAKDVLKLKLFSFMKQGLVEGNGRFVRNFVESIVMEQNMRLNEVGDLSKEALITITKDDVNRGYDTLYSNLNRKK